ncbi:LacI family DNA-binding transcriptional regulator [Dactylosporangium siamense]|uniref:LacI family transcriptional regulator n=1 Tax=Dactylosporangium siamense TaxID=685454 RepID=A0A919UDJ6_9ACTN|nr:LacI family DNA-binding transcriptional regulator [Dactylosporangium siamense]GIG47981.1 LacI family transcriptional regulator [Dactylosporangium siamense]
MTEAQGRSTLREVAERAGVSIGTASAVLSDKTWVSAKARAAVRSAVDELGYRPRSSRPVTAAAAPGVSSIGFVSQISEMFVPTSPYFASVLFGAQQACARFNISTNYEVFDPAAGGLPLSVQRRQVGGLLVLSHASDRAFLRRIIDTGMPCVLLEHEVTDLPVDYVRHDDEAGAYQATTHLLDLGHTDPAPAIITGRAEVLPAQVRLAGYRRALAERGLTERPEHVRRSNFDTRTGAAAMAELLDLRQPPTAVFCANDESALGALEAVRARGLRVPEDISLIGYDDIAMAAHTVPPLTTVAADKELLGAQAVWHLLERIQQPRLSSRDTSLAVRLVHRASTAAPPTR